MAVLWTESGNPIKKMCYILHMNLLVQQIKEEASNVLSLIFEKPIGFQFYPAQFIDVSVDLPAGRQGIKNPDNSRIYSLSSSPTEDFLMITFKKGISDHKKKLQTLKPGDKVSITHPNGTYTLDESSPAVMLAGGVGIAPHRSMIKFAVDQKLNIPITLFYSNSTDDFLFKKELEEWKKLYPKLVIHYIIPIKTGRIDEFTLKESAEFLLKNRECIYYLAGSPNFVASMNQTLLHIGQDSTNIRLDSFDGY